MKKVKSKEPETKNTTGWIEVAPKKIVAQPSVAEPLEVRIGSCVVSVPQAFDKASLAEVCKVLLSL